MRAAGFLNEVPLYQLINANADAVVQALDRIGDVRQYLQLRSQLLADSGAASSLAFQRIYRQYWRMNAARLPPSFYERYFALLEECQSRGQADVGRIAHIISDPDGGAYGLQFSFATKLAHMVDPKVPVFDSFVAAFYFFTPPSTERPFGERLTTLLAFHKFLEREYARILNRGLLTRAIDRLRRKSSFGPDVPDERIIDWLLWAWVSLLRQGAQVRGDALYD